MLAVPKNRVSAKRTLGYGLFDLNMRILKMRTNQKTPKTFQDFLALSEQFNVLCAETSREITSPLYRVIPVMVRIDPDPSKGEVWRLVEFHDTSGGDQATRFALSKKGLFKIAHAAGIVFDPRHTRRTDDGRNPRRVEFQATASVQKSDGQWLTISHSKEIDLDAIEKGIRSDLLREAKEGEILIEQPGMKRLLAPESPEAQDVISMRLARLMLPWEKNKVAFADTGACLRVLRTILNIESIYSAEDLGKAFVLPRVCFNMRYVLRDDEMRRLFLAKGLDSALRIFGFHQS